MAKLDTLYWELRARTEHLKGDFQAAQREARGFTRSIEGPGGPVEAVGKIGGAGKKVADELRRSGPDVERASQGLADRILTTLDTEFRRKRIKLVSALGQGTINETEFKRFGKDLAEEYNKGLKEGLKTLDQLGIGNDFGERAKLTRAFKDLGEDAAEGFEEGFEREAQGFGERLRGFFTRTRVLVAAIFTGIAAKAAAELYKLGVSIDQTQRRFAAVFGEARASVDAFIKDFGRLTAVTQNEGRALTSSTGAIARGLGASEEQAAELAQQVFALTAALRAGRETGEDFERTQERIQKALLNQGEGVRDLGIAYDAASVRQLAFANRSKGTTGELSKLEVALAAIQLIAGQAGIDIQHLGENLDTPAARAERLAAGFRRIKETIAEALLPTFDEFAKKLEESDGKAVSLVRGLTEGFIGLARVVGNAFSIVADLIAGALSNVQLLTLNVFHALGEQLNDLLEGIDRLTPGKQDFRIDLTKIERDMAAAEARATLAADNIKKNWEELKEGATQAFTAFSNADEPAVDALDAVDQKLGDLSAAGGNLDRTRGRMEALEEAIRKTKEQLKELGKITVREPLAPGLGGGDFGLARSLQTGLDAAFPDLGQRRQQLIAAGAQDEVRLRNARAELEKILFQLEDGDVKGRKLRATMAALDVTLDDLDLPPALRELVQQLLDEAEAADKAGKNTNSLKKTLSTFEGLARGVLSVADAVGALDAKSRRALQGVIDLADAAGRIAAGDIVGGVAQGLGGLAGIISGISGETRVGRESRELRQALDRLRDRIDKLGDIFASRTGRETTSLLALAGSDVVRGLPTGSRFDRVTREFIDTLTAELDRLGISFFDLEQIAADAGIPIDELLEILRTGKGDVGLAAIEFEGLQEAIDAAREAAKRAAESFTAEWDRVQATFELLDIEDPVQKAGILIDDFTGRLGKLGQVFAGPLGQFDLSTPEGAAEADKFIEKMWKEYQALSFEDKQAFLGNLTEAQFISWISAIEGFVDEAKQGFPDAAGGSTTPVEVRKAITELSANRLIATQDTAIIQRDKIIQILEAGLLGGPVPSFLIAPPVAPPAAPGVPSASISVGQVSVSPGAVSVTLGGLAAAGGSGPVDLQQLAAALGSAVNRGLADALVEGLDSRLDQIHRVALDASGGSAP